MRKISIIRRIVVNMLVEISGDFAWIHRFELEIIPSLMLVYPNRIPFIAERINIVYKSIRLEPPPKSKAMQDRGSFFLYDIFL